MIRKSACLQSHADIPRRPAPESTAACRKLHHSLRHDLRITPEILSLIAEIDEFKGAWRAIGRIAPERLSGLRRAATIESVGSSTRIEGARDLREASP
jgi:hypothetical protein